MRCARKGNIDMAYAVAQKATKVRFVALGAALPRCRAMAVQESEGGQWPMPADAQATKMRVRRRRGRWEIMVN